MYAYLPYAHHHRLHKSRLLLSGYGVLLLLPGSCYCCQVLLLLPGSCYCCRVLLLLPGSCYCCQGPATAAGVPLLLPGCVQLKTLLLPPLPAPGLGLLQPLLEQREYGIHLCIARARGGRVEV